MVINMLWVQLLNILLWVSNSICDRKVWTYTANVRNKQNWVDGKLQDHCDGLNFPEAGSLNDFVFGQISVKSLTLPMRGAISFYSGSIIIFDENSNDLINCVKLKPVDVKFWNDIRGWNNLDNPDNPAVPYMERLPSRYDDVIFDDVMDARILSILGDIPVKSITVLKGSPRDMLLSDLYPNGRLVISNETCTDPSGCTLDMIEASYPKDVCYYASLVKPASRCEDPITPVGFCHIPICGASILIGYPKVGFKLEKIRQKLEGYGSFTHASKISDSGQVQVVFAEANFSGVSLKEAADFYKLLQDDGSYFSEDLQLLISGPPFSDHNKVLNNALLMTFGTLLAAIVIFAVLIVAFSPVFGNVNIRTRLLGNRPVTTFVLRYDNIHDRGCIIDAAQSVSSSLVNLNQSFENPMYDQSNSRSTSNETLASLKLMENASDGRRGGNQVEDAKEHIELEKNLLKE